jgi:hypothetical protein
LSCEHVVCTLNAVTLTITGVVVTTGDPIRERVRSTGLIDAGVGCTLVAVITVARLEALDAGEGLRVTAPVSTVAVNEALNARVRVRVTASAITVAIREALDTARLTEPNLTRWGLSVTAEVYLTLWLVVLTGDTDRGAREGVITDRGPRVHTA